MHNVYQRSFTLDEAIAVLQNMAAQNLNQLVHTKLPSQVKTQLAGKRNAQIPLRYIFASIYFHTQCP